MKKFSAFSALAVGVLLQTFGVQAHTCPEAVREIAASDSEKIFVLDTNVLHSNPDAIELLSEHHVVIPMAVIEELDRHKKESSDRGRTARMISAEIRRLLDSNKGGSPHQIKLLRGGDLSLIELAEDYKALGFNPLVSDERIVGAAKVLQRSNPGKEIILLSNDNNAAILASSSGIKAERFKIEVDRDAVKEVFSGPVIIETSGDALQRLSTMGTKDGTLANFKSLGLSDNVEFHDNQYVVFRSKNSPADVFNFEQSMSLIWRARRSADGGIAFLPIHKKVMRELVMQPRNFEQVIAYDLLLDDNIKLVTLSGRAGTGKTLLTLAAGLARSPLFSDRPPFDKIIVTRPNQVTGAELGFLPGTLEEKMDPFLGPFEDNLSVIIETLRKKHGPQPLANKLEFPSFSKKRAKSDTLVRSLGEGLSYQDFVTGRVSVRDLVKRIKESDFFSVQAIAYSRGRSFQKTLVIVDEAQNLSLHETKTLLTRAGEGTKIVLLGDVEQIDAKNLTRTSNGIVIAASRFRGKHLAGHVNLTIGERSELATMASQILEP